MGKHDEESAAREAARLQHLAMITVQAWSVADHTMIATTLVHEGQLGTTRTPLGTIEVAYRILHLPSVGQAIYAVGDELCRNWLDVANPS